MKSTSANPGHALEEQTQAILDRSIKPCFRAPYEHIIASANEKGEVRLEGLVADAGLVKEALQLVSHVPGVRLVANHVTVVVRGHGVAL